MFFSRLAALAELLLVLAAGNLIGAWVFGLVAPDAVTDGTASSLAAGAYEGLLILLRLGFAAVLGLLLLYWRKKVTPTRAGLTLAGNSPGKLLRQGVAMGLVAGFLVSLLFAAHALVPLGDGLDAWWTYSERPIDTAFWVYLLGTSILVPPLTEEILVRGYFRVRLVESYGAMSGVILASLVFGLSHTRYLAGDGMLLLFMAIILINSLTWTYLAQKTGSIVPAFVAHAVSNGIGIAVLFNVWIPFAITLFALVFLAKPAAATAREFLKDCSNDPGIGSAWQGVLIVILTVAAALGLLAVVGRTTTLVMLGLVCLLVTVTNLFREA